MEILKELIEKHLYDEIEIIVTENIEKAKVDIEKQIKKITGKIAAQVFGQFSFRNNEHELVIHISTKDLKLI